MGHRTRVLGIFMLALVTACSSTDSQDKAAATDDRGMGASDPNSHVGDGDVGDGDGDLAGDGDGDSGGLAAGDSVDEESQSSSPDPEPRDEEVANPFVDASKDPFSTFGADVDSASYDYFRQTVSEYGSLPEPSHVRIEDFVNFFPYEYPAPAFEAEEPFSIALAATPHPLGRATKLVRVGIQAAAAPSEKKPVNLVYLVDVSGSMSSPDKLPLVQVVMQNSLNVLSATDVVSVVTYAGETSVHLAPTPVKDRKTIEAAIAGLDSGGGTAGGAGIQLAYEQAQKGFIEGGINHVILCTDGDFNIGISDTDGLVSLIREKRDTGVTLTALGFGHGDLNDAMMETVSNAGNGMYSVVFSQDQAVEYANKRLLSTMFHVAKDMKIQVEWNPALVHAYRLLGYEDRAVADDDFRDDTVDGGEVGAGHRVTALYEVVLTGEDVPMPPGAPALDPGEMSMLTSEIGEGELVRVKVRYKQPGASDQAPASEVARAITPADVAELSGREGEDVAWSAAVAGFAEVLRASPYASKAELAAIGTIVDAQKQRDTARGEFASLYDLALGLMSTAAP
jgi:Ca-activated chloride channel family protein